MRGRRWRRRWLCGARVLLSLRGRGGGGEGLCKAAEEGAEEMEAEKPRRTIELTNPGRWEAAGQVWVATAAARVLAAAGAAAGRVARGYLCRRLWLLRGAQLIRFCFFLETVRHHGSLCRAEPNGLAVGRWDHGVSFHCK